MKKLTMALIVLAIIPSVFGMTGSGTPSDPFMVYDITDLQSIDDGDLSAYYEFANDIDAISSHSWNSGTGFKPIGNNTNPFTGHLEGNGYVIYNLFMDDPPREQYTALIEYMTNDGTIQNVGIEDSYVRETRYMYASTLLGWNNGTVWRSWVNNGTVWGYDYIAGLVNWQEDSGIIKETYYIGDVNATKSPFYGGGLFGMNNGGHVNCSYTLGSMYGYPSGGNFQGYGGGLGAINRNDGIVSQCYSKMNVTAGAVGGLINQNGHVLSKGYIYDSFANGTLNIYSWGGGLVGYNTGGSYQEPAYIIRSYYSGSIVGACVTSCNGITGVNNCFGYQNCIQYSYFDNETIGIGYGGSDGRYTWEMKKESTFETWDFIDIWFIEEDVTYPKLSCIWGYSEEDFYCGQLGICTDNIMCLIISALEYFIGMILCIQPIFWVILAGGIGLAVLFGMKSLSKKF